MRISPLLAPLLVVVLGLLPVRGHAAPPPPEVLESLRRFDPATGQILGLLRAVTPGLAQAVLQLGTQEVQRGGPLPQALDAAMLARLDGPPEQLPMVVYKPEPGRLPGAFLVARYRNVTPAQLLARLPLRRATMRHPLIAQYQPLGLAQPATTEGWGDEVQHQQQRAFLALDLPDGARLFGLRPSWTVLQQDTIRWPNGVALAISEATEPTPKEYAKLQTFRDRGKQQRHLDQDYQRALEYRVGHLLVPARDASGVLRDTVHVYFVRIVPAVDPGTELRAGAPLLRWLLDHAAPQVVTGPVALIRKAFGQ
jgi:hypothetical protein